jgi:hypothetical protein
MKFGRRVLIPCDGAGQPRGRIRFRTAMDDEAEEAVPSRI